MRRWLVALALLTALVLAAPTLAQTHLDETRKPPTSDELSQVLTPGNDATPLDDKQKEMIQVAVRWNVFRITSPTVHSKEGEMNRTLSNIEGLLKKVYAREKEEFRVPRTVRDQFTLELLEATRDKILSNSNQPPITQINTARVLAMAAEESGDETLLEYLTTLVGEAERIEGVKYYALKGIRGALEIANRQQPPGLRKADLSRKVRDTLIKYIERKNPLTARARPEEVEGLRFVRREAVRALAEIRDPGSLKEETVALTLVRVLSGDGIDPSSRLDERVEAAIGVMNLDPKKNNDYDPAYAAQHVAYFLSLFGQIYLNPEFKRSREPWKVHAARLGDALKSWKDINDPLVKALVTEGSKMLTDIEMGRSPRLQDYAKILSFKPEGSVYKSKPETAVAFPQ